MFYCTLQVHEAQIDRTLQIDEFLSFLDPMVIDSLEKGHQPYQPSKAADLKKRCLPFSNTEMEKSSAFNFTPYNVLSERSPSKDFKKSQMSSSEASNPVDVWTLKGRSKETSESSTNGKGLASLERRSAVGELINEDKAFAEPRDIADVAMRELQQWKN